jgi:hypothetical protein
LWVSKASDALEQQRESKNKGNAKIPAFAELCTDDITLCPDPQFLLLVNLN